MSVERLRSLVPPLALLLVLALRGAADWRYFERFLGDHGWSLRVVERVWAGLGATYDLHASTRDGRWALYCAGRHAADRGPQPTTN